MMQRSLKVAPRLYIHSKTVALIAVVEITSILLHCFKARKGEQATDLHCSFLGVILTPKVE